MDEGDDEGEYYASSERGKGSVFGDIRREMATMNAETTRGPLGEMVEGDFLRDLVRARAVKEGG